MKHHRHHIYISGALTGLAQSEFESLKLLYERMGDICSSHGFLAYVPHKRSDPVKDAHLSPEQVDRLDRDAVTYACLVIAYVDKPSLGVGIEVEMAHHANKPVILVHHTDTRVSRLIRGNPAIWHIIAFTTHDDLLTKLQTALDEFTNNGLPENIP